MKRWDTKERAKGWYEISPNTTRNKSFMSINIILLLKTDSHNAKNLLQWYSLSENTHWISQSFLASPTIPSQNLAAAIAVHYNLTIYCHTKWCWKGLVPFSLTRSATEKLSIAIPIFFKEHPGQHNKQLPSNGHVTIK